MRVATIDIGTNSVLLLVAEARPGGEPVALEEHATITRLGEGVDKTRKLAPEAIARTTACLESYAAIVERAKVDRIAIVGTSAMRDAGGGEELRAFIRDRFGVEARTISGDEEARLTFEGALTGLALDEGDDDVIVFDIGGGSTEVVRGRARKGQAPVISFASSLDVGSVRLSERHVRSDPPTESELRALEQDVRDALAKLPPLRAAKPVGIAGTVTTLAAVAHAIVPYDGERVHGLELTREEVSAVAHRLSRLPLAERRKLPGMEPKRADVIVAGARLTVLVLEALGATHLRVSDRGVRWGLALELARTST